MTERLAESPTAARSLPGIPATPGLLRELNNRSAMDLLLRHGPLSRSDICRLTGLSKPTASVLLERLESSGRVLRVGTSSGRPGPGAQLYALNPAAGFAGAVDVTPARMHAAIADLTGHTVGEAVLRTPRRRRPDVEATMSDALGAAARTAGLTLPDVGHVVVATPGAFDRVSGQLRYAKHLAGWHEPGIIDRLSKSLGVGLTAENDVNLAAVAEQRSGAGRGYSDFVFFWAGEGLGAALVLDGKLRRGATGGAGEVGMMPVTGAPLVRWVTRGGAGGFEELVGEPAVLELGRSRSIAGATAADVVGAATRDSGAGAAFLDELAVRYATGLAAIVAVVDPALVLLAGPVLRAGGEPLRERLERELAQLAINRIPLKLSALDANPILLGALHTSLDEVRESVFRTA